MGRPQLPIVALAIALALGLFPPASLHAYDDDTHYYFTYYLSRLVGYTPLQAFRIASADIGIDYAAETNPEQYSRVFRAFHADVNDRRVKFHAFRDSRVFNDLALDDQFRAIQESIDRTGMSLWTAAERLNNPGVYLHFLQDKGPHDPYLYGSELGHLLHNHWPDFLSADAGKAERMARDTVNALTTFMRLCCPQQKPRPVSYDTHIRPVLAGLVEANPAPPLPGGRFGRIVAAKVKLAEEIPGENVNSEAASIVIKEALAKLGDASPMPMLGSRTPFEFTAAGDLSDDTLDAIWLTGDLTLVVSDPRRQPLAGVVARLRIGSRVINAPGPLSGAGVSAANGAVTFDKLPVGDLEVVITHAEYREQIVAVTLDRRERFVEVALQPVDTREGPPASAPATLRVRVVDADTARDVDARLRVSGTTLTGVKATYAPAPGAAIEVAPGAYEISAVTAAKERASVWADVPAGRATDVELRIGEERATNLAAGLAALRRELDLLMHHPGLARRGDLETLRPRALKIAASLAADRVQAGALASELSEIVMPACRLLSQARALQPAAVDTAERNADRVEALIAEVRKASQSCTDQASLDRARKSYAEAVRLVADTQRIADRTADDPDRVRDAARIVESSKPLVARAAQMAARLEVNLSQADALRSMVTPALVYNDDVDARVPAIVRRIHELRGVADGDTATLAELAELAGLAGRVSKLPVGNLEDALREAELARGLATALERPVSALQTCPAAGAVDVAALVDRLQTANMLSQLTLLSEGAECQRGLDTCRTKLAAPPAAPSGTGALPAERRLEDVVVASREVTITVWDAACEDGDRITVRVNGAPVFQDHELKNQRVSRSITLTSDVNAIEVAATSTGHDCAPQTPADKRVNTGAVSISGAARGGDQQWTLRDRNSSISRLIVSPNATPSAAGSTTPPASTAEGARASATGAVAPRLNIGSVSGDVRAIARGGRGVVVTPGTTLAAGSMLQTGRGARGDLRTADGSAITLGAMTRARLTATVSGGHDVSLAGGSVEVTHPTGASSVRVVTEHGVIETIDTRYRVERTADGTIVDVLEGWVRLTGAAILRLSLPGQQLGKSLPTTKMELRAPGRAILLPASAVTSFSGSISGGSGRPAPTAVPGLPAQPARGIGGPGTIAAPTGRASYLPATSQPAAMPATRPAVLSRPDPWSDAQVQALIDEWLRRAVPTGAPRGQMWRYSSWGVVLAPGVAPAGPPEHPAGWTRHQTVWSVRARLGSQNLCTLADFVERRLAGQSLEGCSSK